MSLNWRLFQLTQGFRLRLAGAAVLGLAASMAGIGRLVLSGYVLGLVFQGQPLSAFVLPVLGVALCIVLRAGLEYAKEVMGNRTASAIKLRLRQQIYQHTLALGPGHFDQERTGDVVLAMVEGVEQLETFLGQFFPQFAVAALTPLLIFLGMAWFDLPTALVFVGFALFTLIVPLCFTRWTASSSLQRRNAYSAMGADFLDAVQGLATLKAFGQSGAHGTMLAQRSRHLYRSTMGVLAVNIITSGLITLGVSAGAGVALGWGALRVSQGDLALPTLLVVLMLGVEVFRPLRELARLYHRGMIAMSTARAIFAILDAVPMVQEGPNGPAPTQSRQGPNGPAPTQSRQPPQPAVAVGPALSLTPEVRLDGVSFGYPKRPQVLHNICLTVQPGQRLGIVGPSGAGKSTLVWLLLRFFDPQQGTILLGGHDIRTLPLDVLRRHIAVVMQETYLVHGTVADNLRFGKPDATQEELAAAARAANAHEFIMALPHGYETIVGERGLRLSGGQRQRLAIARALLKDAPVLLLDEALSSVDTENEALIQDALERLMVGRTTLIIAHRLSSVIGADRIIVMEEGALVESGTHRELVGAGGTYARLMGDQVVVKGEDALRRRSHASPAGTELATRSGTAHEFDGSYGNGLGSLSRSPERAGGEGRCADAVAPRAKTPSADTVAEEGTDGTSQNQRDYVLGCVTLWRRLLLLVKNWWRQLGVTFICGVGHIVAVIGIGVVSAVIVGQVARGVDCTVTLTTLGLLIPLSAVLHYLESWLAHDLAYRLLAEMRVHVYEMLDRLAPAYLFRRRTGDLVSLVTADVETVELFFAHTIAPGFVAVMVPVTVLAVVGYYAWPLALVLAPFLVLVGLSPFIAGRQQDRLARDMREQLGDVNAYMVDSIQGLKEIVAFTRGPWQLLAMQAYGARLNNVRLRFLNHLSFEHVLVEAFMGVGGLAVMTLGAVLVAHGHLTASTVPVLTLLAMASFVPVSEIARIGKELSDALASARRLFTVEDEPVPVVDGPDATIALARNGTRPPTLQYERVEFTYLPGEAPALRQMTFTVEQGQTVALVGRSGSGKTTALHLLLRFWDPHQGRILLGGHDLRQFQLDSLRRQMALVSQDTYLFNASVRDNLRLGRPEATDAELQQAARQANAHAFIMHLPDGYDTRIGERAVQLSGGQRQRLAIARAILKDAPILLLDEATSHLDSENERLVHEALKRLMAGRTTLLIAHRLSTVRDADLIVVLDEGRVVEQGTHAELLAQGGVYARLVAMQETDAPSPATRRVPPVVASGALA